MRFGSLKIEFWKYRPFSVLFNKRVNISYTYIFYALQFKKQK